MSEQQNYPLAWPDGWPRTPARQRERSRFQVTLSKALDDLYGDLQRWGIDDRAVVLSTNLRPRLDGRPYASQPKTGKTGFDPGAAIYFRHQGVDKVMACDRFSDVDGNVRAIGLSIKALRSLERYGASQILERAFRGFDALPDPDDPFDVLGLARDGATSESINLRFRTIAKAEHPDAGGSGVTDMARIKRARDAALRLAEGR